MTTPGGPAHSDRKIFGAALLVLTVLAIAPLWCFEFLPLQDHPRHLLIAQVMHSFDDPSFDWSEHWEVDRQFGPYALAYGFLEATLAFVDVETAGRLLVSFYILLLSAFALREARLSRERAPPWALLLVLPLAFNPIYFLGLQNFLLSIPLLFLSLQELEAFSHRSTGWRSAAPIALLQLLLFLAHPYTLLVYAGLAILLAASAPNARRRRMLAPPLLLVIAFSAWAALTPTGASALPDGGSGPSWWSPLVSLKFALLPFVGMRITEGIAWPSAILWLGVAALFLTARREPVPERERPAVMGRALVLGASLLAVAILPFSVALYSYLNVRLLPIALIAGAWLLSRMPLGRARGLGCTAVVALLLITSIQLHARLSREIAEIDGILEAMEPNEAVLPIIADGASRHIDARFFYQFHTHVADYYHLRVGGGLSPAYRGFTSRLMPARPLPEWQLPSARSRNLDWKRIGETYRYIVGRGLPERIEAVVLANSELRRRSGDWSLFEVRPHAGP